ncbi:hypothetical protein DY138_00625 [Apilactobacillus timberlakei]|uniref:hypothetical protein n=1 Tax=Apilactobacillus timberlakei TaxID=2008380 RepID=UPI001128F728|nr:hypothetical protein [Apilactobacillus timberlakei]TPR19974.1 hypothetical protein DY138_00625 [Apilactobacillus timberlakei]TPR21692.1 hypothetical protein DY061_00540 [Apilactobacillus timberlakei]TPR22938.1 hypothetical protein DY083_02360 [Apilactobacillus timberlakei]
MAKRINSSDFIITQYIRKSNLHSRYISDYLNVILKSIIGRRGQKNSHVYDVYIWGSCWAKRYNTSNRLVNTTFNDISNDKVIIHLENHYLGFSSFFTYNAFNKMHYKLTASFLKNRDHSKVIAILEDGNPVFYMVGSSNFSYQTYTQKNSGINQSDIAFIRNNYSTGSLIKEILKNEQNNNSQMEYIIKDVFDNIEFDSHNESYWNTYHDKNNIFSIPYANETNILKDFFKEQLK